MLRLQQRHVLGGERPIVRSGVDSDWPQEEARRFHGSRTADDAIGGGEERDAFGDGRFGERLRGCGGGGCVDVLECDEAEVVERAAERGGELDCDHGRLGRVGCHTIEDFRWRRGHLPSQDFYTRNLGALPLLLAFGRMPFGL